jgi:hypothetical protein
MHTALAIVSDKIEISSKPLHIEINDDEHVFIHTDSTYIIKDDKGIKTTDDFFNWLFNLRAPLAEGCPCRSNRETGYIDNEDLRVYALKHWHYWVKIYDEDGEPTEELYKTDPERKIFLKN